VNLFDAIVAATAAAHGLAVWTQDGDFEVIAEIAGGPPVLLA
jgi:predicted nucleic acid-binding protein